MNIKIKASKKHIIAANTRIIPTKIVKFQIRKIMPKRRAGNRLQTIVVMGKFQTRGYEINKLHSVKNWGNEIPL